MKLAILRALLHCMAIVALLVASKAAAGTWIGIWGASPSNVSTTDSYQNQTIRQSVQLDGGGRTIRLRISNALSGEPLVLGRTRIARPGTQPGSIEPGGDVAVTFGGQTQAFVPAHATALSDPVGFEAATGRDLVVSILIASSSRPTVHEVGLATAYVAPGDQTGATILDEATPRDTRIVVSGIDAETTSQRAGTIVALGDSITDGFRSTPDLDRRWPDVLARRIAASGGLPVLGIVNAGVSGNRLLRDGAGPNALSRLPGEVLALPGLRVVCVLEGINDIVHGANATDPADRVTAADLIAGYEQIVAQVHAHGAKVFLGTLTPFSGSGLAEQVRQQTNAWIRLKDGFDGVLDFDAALRDPTRPSQFLARYDSGDHIHPNDAGYAAMADSIDLDSLR